jgi:hypothetical protein
MLNKIRHNLSLDSPCQIWVIVILLILLSGCQSEPLKEASFIVKAELLEIKGGIPENINYKYVFIMKYKVLSGDIEENTEIYVGHHNPVLGKFTVGDIHDLALESDLLDIYGGGVVNRYFDQDIPSPYLAVDMR